MTNPMDTNENTNAVSGYLSREAQHTQLAWAIFGSLVAFGAVQVDFQQNGWASQVEGVVTTIAATLDQHDE